MGYRIKAAETTEDVLPAIASYVRAGRCALFVGAGLSRAAGYPNWRELLQKLIKEVPNGPGDARARSQLRRLLQAGRFADVADECRQLLGPTQLFWFLRRELIGRHPRRESHLAITRTAYRCIVTTNFDTLLEDAYAAWGLRGVPKAPCGYELAEHGTLLLDDAFFVLKAHGSITDQSSIVFATEDYRRIIHSNPAFQSVMSAVLMSNAVVFVGYSLSDPNFRLLLESQLATFGPKAPPRYAFMEGTGTYESALLQRTMGIRVLPYPTGQHHQVDKFLQAVAKATIDDRGVAANRTRVGSALRRPKPLDVLTVSIKAQGPLMDARWHRASSSEWSGAAVRLEERAFDSLQPVPWNALRELLPRAADNFENDPRLIFEIGDRLKSALPPALHDTLAALKNHVVLLDLDPAAASLPWEWVVVDGKPLIDRAPVMRAMPNVSDQARGRPFVHSPLRALIIGDTQPKLLENGKRLILDGSASEALNIRNALAQSFRDSHVVLLTGPHATYDRVLHELRSTRFDVVHFTGHAWVKNGAAYMALYDHVAYAAELAMLLNRHPPALLFINSHHTGFVPAFTTVAPIEMPSHASIEDVHRLLGQRRFGFEHVAARAGVGSFVGSIGEQSDLAGQQVAELLYGQLLQGAPLAKALHAARLGSRQSDDITSYCLLAAGYPNLRLARGERA